MVMKKERHLAFPRCTFCESYSVQLKYNTSGGLTGFDNGELALRQNWNVLNSEFFNSCVTLLCKMDEKNAFTKNMQI